MPRLLVGQLGLLSVPILLFLAWRGWANCVRTELPPWRNGLAISALLLLSLNWLVVAFFFVLEVPVFFDPHWTRPDLLTDALLTFCPLLSISVILLAFALRGAPRVRILLAALLMLVSWPLMGYVHY